MTRKRSLSAAACWSHMCRSVPSEFEKITGGASSGPSTSTLIGVPSASIMGISVSSSASFEDFTLRHPRLKALGRCQSCSGNIAKRLQHLVRSFAHQHVARTLEHDDARIGQGGGQLRAALGRRHEVALAQNNRRRYPDLCRSFERIAIAVAGGEVFEENTRALA